MDKLLNTPSAKMPVLAKNTAEFVRWLSKNKYSRREFEFYPDGSVITEIRSRTFVVLDGAYQRNDWQKVERHFLEIQPTLILG